MNHNAGVAPQSKNEGQGPHPEPSQSSLHHQEEEPTDKSRASLELEWQGKIPWWEETWSRPRLWLLAICFWLVRVKSSG